jgi:hypothetical protein
LNTSYLEAVRDRLDTLNERLDILITHYREYGEGGV